MPDTQWPRFMVFQKMDQNKPFIHNGTVHAPDIEMALLNGRDVFGRRPFAVAMYVVKADEIFSKTREEIQDGWGVDIEVSENSGQDFLVYGKLDHQAQCEEIGLVEAVNAEQAMKKGIEINSELPALMWWVFPKNSVFSSSDDDIDSMFKPVEEHRFKNQADYPVITMMRQIRAKGKLEE